MNDPEHPPTSSDRPAPYDPPDEARPSPGPGGPPGDTGSGPVASPEPEARWEDVVDPMPEPAPAPRPAPQTAAPRATEVAVADADADDAEDDYADYDPATTRWVSLLATVGTALIGIVSVQVLTSVVEGFTLKSGQRVGVPDDLFHRLGYPFGGLGATALVFLVLGVVLISMPNVLDELLSESQDRVVGAALVVAIVMGVIIAIGALLAVRANLHEYSAKSVPVPTYVRIQFTNFLLGSLGAAALALFGAIASMSERGRERF